MDIVLSYTIIPKGFILHENPERLHSFASMTGSAWRKLDLSLWILAMPVLAEARNAEALVTVQALVMMK